MSATKSTGGDGIGFVGLLQVLFIALKLTGFISWPWLWVLAPVWGATAIVLLFIAIVCAVLVARDGDKSPPKAKVSQRRAFIDLYTSRLPYLEQLELESILDFDAGGLLLRDKSGRECSISLSEMDDDIDGLIAKFARGD